MKCGVHVRHIITIIGAERFLNSDLNEAVIINKITNFHKIANILHTTVSRNFQFQRFLVE